MRVRLAVQITLIFFLVGICAGEYRIGVDDLLSISVWRHPELSLSNARVRPDGMISLPVVGEVRAAGYTPADLQREIASLLRRYVKGEPIVTVSVLQFNSLKVNVFGAVKNPGSYTFAQSPTPLELIAKCGGMTENAEPSSARIISADGTIQRVDLSSAILSGGQLPRLNAGDTLFIPAGEFSSQTTAPRSIRITVLGSVRSPGTYDFQDTPTLIEVLSRAGWTLNETALEEVRVVRTVSGRSESVRVNVKRFLESGDPSLLPVLESGDLILVPEAKEELTILGGVNNPGTFQIRGPITLLEALGMAGGLSESADPRAVKIGRLQNGRYSWNEVDVTPWVKGRTLSGTSPPIVMPGDLIIVPATKVSFWGAAGMLRAAIAFIVDLIAIYGVYQLTTK
jgi:protein involved in polysaccharide export with SLBB domain